MERLNEAGLNTSLTNLCVPLLSLAIASYEGGGLWTISAAVIGGIDGGGGGGDW